MSKILFCLKGMYLGGTEKALLSMLNSSELKKHDVTLLLADDSGTLMHEIPKYVKVEYISFPNKNIKENYLRGGFLKNLKHYLRQLKLFEAFKMLFKRIIIKDNIAELNTSLKKFDVKSELYDFAVSYQFHNSFCTRYVVEKINANKKYVWIHNDLKTTKYDYKSTLKYIYKYDLFIAVSKQLLEEYSFCIPLIKNKIIVKYNAISMENIKKLSLEPIDDLIFNNEKFTILSIGRLNNQKGFDIAIKAAAKLKFEHNINFNWFIIGNGEQYDYLLKLIDNNNIMDSFHLIGSRSNPYKYISKCDLYVQPSRHEAFCTTTNEAKVLCKPIITTNVCGAHEQFVNNLNGLIVECNVNDIVSSILYMYNNKTIRDKLSDNLQKNSDITLSSFNDLFEI